MHASASRVSACPEWCCRCAVSIDRRARSINELVAGRFSAGDELTLGSYAHMF
jgi:hypothetical protein